MSAPRLSAADRDRLVNYFLHGSDGTRLVEMVEQIIATHVEPERRRAERFKRRSIRAEAAIEGTARALDDVGFTGSAATLRKETASALSESAS